MKKVLRIGVVGASGRMGQELTSLIKEDANLEAAVGISLSKVEAAYRISTRNFDPNIAEEADVWIDFSLPTGFERILKFCVESKKPLISGTTGLSSEDMKSLKKASSTIPILWSSNMSLGILALKKAMESLIILNGFDFQIEEIHHKMKKDRPSGTAITLQEKLIDVTQNADIPTPISIRGGGIFGVHKVFAMSSEEVLTFEHQALNRKVFARGALWAAQKIVTRPAGLYKLEDLIQWP